MRLKIVSDGTPGGTHVTNEDGERVERVRAVAFSIAHDKAAELTLTVLVSEAEIEGPLTELCIYHAKELEHEDA